MANDMDAVKTDLTDLKRDMDALRADLGRLVGNFTHQAQARFTDTTETARRWVTDVAGPRAGEFAKEAREQIEERPGATAAVAFGVGFALALLLTRRR
jgi:ElaB/YqjD/DUF883 family membrane-anchored ribosome-binding protein